MSVQRWRTLRVTRAYRTTSMLTILAVAGLVPVYLLADERQQVYRDELRGTKRKNAKECVEDSNEEGYMEQEVDPLGGAVDPEEARRSQLLADAMSHHVWEIRETENTCL